MTTSARGMTAPAGSRTVPLMLPTVLVWARTPTSKPRPNISSTAAKMVLARPSEFRFLTISIFSLRSSVVFSSAEVFHQHDVIVVRRNLCVENPPVVRRSGEPKRDSLSSLGSLRFADHHHVACGCATRADELTAIAREIVVPDLFALEVSQLSGVVPVERQSPKVCASLTPVLVNYRAIIRRPLEALVWGWRRCVIQNPHRRAALRGNDTNLRFLLGLLVIIDICDQFTV